MDQATEARLGRRAAYCASWGWRAIASHLLTMGLVIGLSACSDGSGDSTQSDTPLTVTKAVPANGNSTVPVDSALVVSFNNVIDPTSVDINTVTLTSGENRISGTTSVAGTTVVFQPTSALTGQTVYSLVVAGALRDVLGHSLSAPTTVVFTTGVSSGAASTPPSATNSTATVVPNAAFGLALAMPASGATKVSTAVAPILSFNLPLDPASANTAITLNAADSSVVPSQIVAAGSMVQITPNAALTAGATYTIRASTALTSSTGVKLAEATSVTFQVAPLTGRYAGRAYIMDATGAIQVFDTSTLAKVATVPATTGFSQYFGAGSNGFKPDFAHSKIYYVYPSIGSAPGGVNVVDTVSNTTQVSIPACLANSSPTDLAVSPAGDRVYVACPNDNLIAVVDTSNNTITQTFPTSASGYGIAINPSGTQLWVSDYNNSIMVLDAMTGATITQVPGVNGFPAATFDSTGARAFTRNANMDKVIVIDTASFATIASIDVGSNSQSALTVDPTKPVLYSVLYTQLELIDINNYSLITAQPIANIGNNASFMVNAAGTTGFLQFAWWGLVSVVDMTTFQQVGVLPVNNATAMAITP